MADKCSMCKEPLHPDHMGIRCNRCQRKLERDTHQKPLKGKIAKLEADLAESQQALREIDKASLFYDEIKTIKTDQVLWLMKRLNKINDIARNAVKGGSNGIK